MGIGRYWRVQRQQHVYLPRRIVEVIIATYHVRYTHIHVVDNDAEVIGGAAIRSGDDQVIEFLVLKCNATMHQIQDYNLAIERIPESYDGRNTLARFEAIAASTVVTR